MIFLTNKLVRPPIIGPIGRRSQPAALERGPSHRLNRRRGASRQPRFAAMAPLLRRLSRHPPRVWRLFFRRQRLAGFFGPAFALFVGGVIHQPDFWLGL